MNDLLSSLEKGGSFFIFDHLTVEIHVWKIIRDSSNNIRTWELVYANPPALKTWGFDSLDKIKGKITDEIFGEGASEHYLPVVNKIFEEGKPYIFRDYFENLKKHFRFTSIPLGEYFITTGDDITDFIEEQESIQDENRELDQLVKQRSAMLRTSEEEIHILNEIEKEKEKIYMATIHSAQHIIFNLLNQLQLVQLEISNHSSFDKEVLSLFKDMLSEATTLMNNLSAVEKVDDKLIRQSVAPK